MIDFRMIADIQAAEGCRLRPYQDTMGLWTCGYGHLLMQTEDLSSVMWTQEQCDTVLMTDLELAQEYAERLPEWQYLDTPARRNAVIELYFNMGSKWLTFLVTRAAIQAQHWQAAHDALLDSLWAAQVGITRSSRLAGYLLTGAYNERV